jgi:hypothetical protein
MQSNDDATENGFTRRTVLKSSSAVAGAGALAGRGRAGTNAVNRLNLVEAGVVYELESTRGRLPEVHLIEREQYLIEPAETRLLVAPSATDDVATSVRNADTLVSPPSGDLVSSADGSTVELSLGGRLVAPTAVRDDLRPIRGVQVVDPADERSVTLTVGPTVTVADSRVEPGASDRLSLGTERVTVEIADGRESDPATATLDAEATLVVRNHRRLDVVDPRSQ